MKISYEWLREYVNTKVRAENLASMLTMVGHEVESAEKKGKDFIFNMEITPNRPDCLSHIGVAREVAAITKKKLKVPEVNITTVKPAQKIIKVEIEDKLACPRYSARIITDIKVLPSPKWLIRRIESIGLRPVNNIVDITNFVLFETGQPLHAFDLDKINGKEIIVRRARQGEKIVTIDGIERELKTHMLVIADNKKAIAIAGVMGGKETEVTRATKNILLESACFTPAVVRKTAFSLGLGTDSSYRFERGVDLTGVAAASERAAALIRDVARANISFMADIGIKAKAKERITLHAEHVNKILGTTLTPQQIKEPLTRLEFEIKGVSTMEVIVPGLRCDITTEADLVEEIARIYGYENITAQAPTIIPTQENPLSKGLTQKRELTRQILASSGFNEVITYSLISRDVIKKTAFSEEGVIEIKNPLSKEQEVMRQSLLPGIIKTASYNLNRQIEDIKIFELSSIYFEKEGLYNEEPSLALAQYDKTHKAQAAKNSASSVLFQLKGTIILLGERLGIKEMSFEKTSHPLFVPDETITVLSGYAMLGTIGKIRPDILQAFDIKGHLYAAELNFKTIENTSSLDKFYQGLPRFPFSYRDVSFAIDKAISYREIRKLIKNTVGALVEEIEFLSEYNGGQIPPQEHGIAVRVIYRSKDKTLTEEEINKADTAIRESLTKTFNVKLR